MNVSYYNDNDKVERYKTRHKVHILYCYCRMLAVLFYSLLLVCFYNREDGWPFIMQVAKAIQTLLKYYLTIMLI